MGQGLNQVGHNGVLPRYAGHALLPGLESSGLLKIRRFGAACCVRVWDCCVRSRHAPTFGVAKSVNLTESMSGGALLTRRRSRRLALATCALLTTHFRAAGA